MANFSIRDKAVLIGLYLSKFDKQGTTELGFTSLKHACNVLGASIGAKADSIKNYCNEFDPYFPNPRKGWHKRPMREYCKRLMEEFGSLNFEAFNGLVKSLVIKDYSIEQFLQTIDKTKHEESIAKRLATGIAAEEYFKANYTKVDEFRTFDLSDATNLACGFDFKMSLKTDFYCVEVKGLSLSSGNIMLTEKEYHVAEKLKSRYCLFIVSNFAEFPIHQFYFDPINSELTFKKVQREIVQVNYTTQI